MKKNVSSRTTRSGATDFPCPHTYFPGSLDPAERHTLQCLAAEVSASLLQALEGVEAYARCRSACKLSDLRAVALARELRQLIRAFGRHSR